MAPHTEHNLEAAPPDQDLQGPLDLGRTRVEPCPGRVLLPQDPGASGAPCSLVPPRHGAQ